MIKIRMVFAAMTPLLLTGCFGPNQALRIETSPALAVAARANDVDVLPSVPVGAKVLGSVEGASCQNKIWDPKASEPAALDQAKLKAAALGATAITDLSYATSGTNLVANCWTLITATATAIRQ